MGLQNTKSISVQSKFLSTLVDRGFYNDCNNLNKLDALSSESKLIVYVGFDLTASSLHIGNLVTLMAMRHAMSAGHKCIALLGGGTTYIGDPSGRDEMRKILTPEQIAQNKIGICNDIVRLLVPNKLHKINLSESLNNEVVLSLDNLLVVDNYHWLKGLNYIDLLREIGSHFTVNKMVKMDAISSRLQREQPLSFIEFNYPILQAYDFYYLSKKYGCNCQIGGSDQWGNILRGIELIDKMYNLDPAHNKHGSTASSSDIYSTYGFTIPLITRSDGRKMGKSEKGAMWLNPKLLGDIEYWQYFRNIDDRDVTKFLLLFTDLPAEEIHSMCDMNINDQKDVLAFEALKICRGEDTAIKTRSSIKAVFNEQLDHNNMLDFTAGRKLVDEIADRGLASSRSEIRRLIVSCAVRINGCAVRDIDLPIDQTSWKERFGMSINCADGFLLSIGKKRRYSIRIIE